MRRISSLDYINEIEKMRKYKNEKENKIIMIPLNDKTYRAIRLKRRIYDRRKLENENLNYIENKNIKIKDYNEQLEKKNNLNNIINSVNNKYYIEKNERTILHRTAKQFDIDEKLNNFNNEISNDCANIHGIMYYYIFIDQKLIILLKKLVNIEKKMV